MAAANGVYWIGRDGNYYIRTATSGGVKNLGQANYDNPNSNIINGLEHIPDPVAGDAPTPPPTDTARRTTTNRTAPTAPAKVVNQAAVANSQKAIDSLDTELNLGYANIDNSYRQLMGDYDSEAQRANEDYTEQDTTNNQNLERNKQNALLAAANGRRGLRGTLSAIGALSGDGGRIADRVVQQGANADIGEAAETFTTNAGTLTKAKSRFEEEDAKRRQRAEDERNNQRIAKEGEVLSKRQQMYQKMADLYSEGGDTGNYNTWLNRAGDLNPVIAQKTAVQATPFSRNAAAFTPGKLQDYLAGATDMTVDIAPGGNGGVAPNTLLAGPGRRRRDEELAVA